MASGSCGDNATWNLNESTGVLTVSGTGAIANYFGGTSNSYSSHPLYSYQSIITQVIIESGITSIGSYAFNNCRTMTSVTIPEGVTSMSAMAFGGCASLTTIDIPASVTNIAFGSNGTFWNTYGLSSINVSEGNTVYSSHDGVLFNKAMTTLLLYPIGKNTTLYKVPNGVTLIGDLAFYRVDALTEIVISDTVTRIGEHDGMTYQTIYMCENLSRITFGKNVNYLSACAVYQCYSLKEIYFKGETPTFGYYSFMSSVYNNLALSTKSSTPVTATVYTTGWGSDDVFTTAIRGKYTTFTYEILKTSPEIPVKVDGTWKASTPYVKVNGEWKEVTAAYVKVNGEWKEVV